MLKKGNGARYYLICTWLISFIKSKLSILWNNGNTWGYSRIWYIIYTKNGETKIKTSISNNENFNEYW